MKLDELKEMTMTFGKVSIGSMAETFKYLQEHGKLIGHQDTKPVHKCYFEDFIYYGIMNDDKITTILTGKNATYNGNKFFEVYVVETLPEYQTQEDAKRIYWFLKDQEGLSLIGHGYQSKLGIKFVQSMAKSKRFDMSWYNIKTGKKEKYDHIADGPADSKYRDSYRQTDWRILIEGSDVPIFERFCILTGPSIGINKFYRVFPSPASEE